MSAASAGIDRDLHERLVLWARWCAGRHLPRLEVRCESAESAYLPPLEGVYSSTEEALKAALPPINGEHAFAIERIVLKLPDKPRLALRLHYVWYRKLAHSQKCRMLGVSNDGYNELVRSAALMVGAYLTTARD